MLGSWCVGFFVSNQLRIWPFPLERHCWVVGEVEIDVWSAVDSSLKMLWYDGGRFLTPSILDKCLLWLAMFCATLLGIYGWREIFSSLQCYVLGLCDHVLLLSFFVYDH